MPYYNTDMKTSAFERFRLALRRVFFWLPSSTNEEVEAEHVHDHALVAQVVTGNRASRLRQLRHASRVFTFQERRTVAFATLVAILSFVGAAGILVWEHTVWAPAVGGTYTEALIGQPKYINPIDAISNDVDRDLVRLGYSGLFRMDQLDAIPDLADSFRFSEDGKELTVQLRPDARFQDGEPVTSADVQFTFDSILDPSRKSPLAPNYRGISILTPDDRTVVFRLEKADATFLQKLTIGILPSHLWQDVNPNNARLSELNIKPIGSGPFRVKSFLRDTTGYVHSYTLERAETYYGIKPYLKTVVFQFFPDRTQALDAFRSELIDGIAFAGSSEAGKLLSSTRKQGTRLELPEETIAFLNVKDPLLSQMAVREALSLAVQREDIIAAANGFGQAVSGPFPYIATTGTPASLEQARRILDEAGWIVPQGGNVRIFVPKVKPIPSSTKSNSTSKAKTIASTTSTAETAQVANASSTELALTITTPDTPDIIAIAETLKRQWSLLGAKVEIQTLSTEELKKKSTRERAGQIILLNIILTPNQDLFPFWWSGQSIDRGANFSNLADRTVDDALEKTRTATNTADLEQSRLALSQAILQTHAAIFLIRPQHAYLLSPSLRGTEQVQQIATPAERFQHIERWFIKRGWHWK